MSDAAKDREQADALRDAMIRLGDLWGLRRPVRANELGRALRLGPDEPGKSVGGWLQGRHRIPGAASCAIEMMLLGALPPDGLSAVVLPSPLKGRPRAPRKAKP